MYTVFLIVASPWQYVPDYSFPYTLPACNPRAAEVAARRALYIEYKLTAKPEPRIVAK